jgi:molybdopterin-guanine dinucleotide biosynthesis protein A
VALSGLTDHVIINANRNIEHYQQFGLPVISDLTDSSDGPLAGILTAMNHTDAAILVTLPCDSPFVNAGHLQKLLQVRAEHDADAAVAFDGERLHPVFLALKTTLRVSLAAYLASGQRKIDNWLRQHAMVQADFRNEPELFINVNTLAELSDLEAKVER